MLKDIDFKSGKIEYDQFNINFDISFKDQPESLLEDLLQVNYQNRYIIDLGWYPEFDSNGSFIIYIIGDYNWDRPIKTRKCREKKDLKNNLVEFVNIVENFLYQT